MCCTYCVVLLTELRSFINMTAWSSCTLNHFVRQFFFYSSSLKNDVRILMLHKVANFFYTVMTHNIIDLWLNSPLNIPLMFVHKQRMVLIHLVAHVLRKPVLSCPLEFYIRKDWEIATEHMVYWHLILPIVLCACVTYKPCNLQETAFLSVI